MGQLLFFIIIEEVGKSHQQKFQMGKITIALLEVKQQLSLKNNFGKYFIS